MPEVLIKNIPDYTQFGRAAKLRLNPNHIEDLQWTIPEELPKLTAITDPEVSEVNEDVKTALSHNTQEYTGQCFKTTQPDTTWFWSITERFKEGLCQRVTSISVNPTPYVLTNHCKYMYFSQNSA